MMRRTFTRNLSLLLALPSLVAGTEPLRPGAATLPERDRVTIRCGDIALLLRRKSQWTPGRIDFRGAPMTTERSAYGTVFSFPGVGFIGTGHLENEREPIESLSFVLDGRQVENPGETLEGGRFRFERVSRVRAFRVHGIVRIENDRLLESVTVSTDEAVPLKLVYHFMHAWRPTVNAYLAGRDDAPEPVARGSLEDGEEVTRKFSINERVDWIAVYEPDSGQFAVSRLLEAPERGGHVSMIWNVPGTYRKYYLKCFQNETVPAGFSGTWRMVTGFGVADPNGWEDAARALAVKLRD